MAFARPHIDENARERAAAPGKGGQAPAPAQRKALGDIGNLVGPFNTRCNVGKENAKKAANDQPPNHAGPLTRRAAAAQGVVVDGKGGWGNTKVRSVVPRGKDAETASAAPEPAAAKVSSKIPTGRSMSALLQSRSEAAAAAAETKPQPLSPMPDIDSEDKGNELAASEYVADIFSYYKRVEPQYRVSPTYMSRQTDINDNMRAILIDWLVEVHYKFRLMPETLFLTTNIIDRFLECKRVSRRNLQLVGVTAMLIASKYEEIWAPEVKDFVYISDEAYTREQILNMEKMMLNTLSFNLTVPTPFNFLARFLKAAGAAKDTLVVAYATYLVELAMLDYSMLKYSYSMLAAAAVFTANKALSRSPHLSHSLKRHAGFTEDGLLPCAVALADLHRSAPAASLRTVYKKYSHTQYGRVSVMQDTPAF
ncbi:g102 [Coccomyxa elongata]